MIAWVRIALKDLRLEVRARETLLAMVLVAFASVTIGLLALHDHGGGHETAAAIVWLSLSFAAAVGLARAFGAEHDRGTLETLLTLPVERGTLYLGKVVASFATMFLVGLTASAAYFLIAGESPGMRGPAFVLILALGTLGLAATGTMLSAVATQTRSRDVLLPVLLFPLLVPLLIAAVHGTIDVLSGEPFREWRPELMLLVGYDIAFLAVSVPLFEAAVEG